MRKISSRVETLDYLLNNRYYEHPEEISLRKGRDIFYVINDEDYSLKFMSTLDEEGKCVRCEIPEGAKCYQMVVGRSTPCEGCAAYARDKNATSVWITRDNDKDTIDLIRNCRHITQDGTLHSNICTHMGDLNEAIRHMQRALSARELITRCLATISDDSIPEKEKFTTILKNSMNFYDSTSAYVLLFGENPRVYTCNFPDLPDATPLIDEFPQYIIDKAERQMTPDSVLYLDNLDDIKDEEPQIYKHFQRWGIRCMVVAPIFMGSELTGIIVLHNINLNQRDIPALCSVAELTANLDYNISSHLKQERIMNTDALTGVLNFEAFKRGAQDILLENPDKKFAIWSFDIKDFRNINDLFGYDSGDDLLRYWAKNAMVTKSSNELVCRVQADTICYLSEYESDGALHEYFSDLTGRLQEFVHDNISNALTIELAAGVYITTENDSHTLNEMFNRAHMARTVVKNTPGSILNIYDVKLHEDLRFAKELEIFLPEALSSGLIVPFFQPQLVLSERAKKKGRIRAEALARWINKDGTIFARPDQFIPICERNGQIAEVDHCIFRQVCQTIAELKKKKIKACFSINVSRHTLFRPGFIEYYEDVRKEFGLTYDDFVLEFTESICVNDVKKFQEIITKLEKLGFVCSMDDFGSDYSSLNVLHLLDLNELKLDKAFFMSEENKPKKFIIINNILKLSNALNMESVAEGIESEEMIEELSKSNCDYIQGFVYAKPMPKRDFLTWISKNKI